MTYNDVMKVLVRISYKDWQLCYRYDGDRLMIYWDFAAPCTTTGIVQRWQSRKWPLSMHMVEGEIVQTAFMAALQAEEHESRESFKYKGIAPFNPHIKFAAIMESAQHIEVRS